MANASPAPETRLFVYGTLIAAPVLEFVIGRTLPSRQAEIAGFARYCARGYAFPGMVREAGAITPGLLYEDVVADDLVRLDRFETDLYERILAPIRLGDGTEVEAQVYVLPDAHRHVLGDTPWNAEAFLANGVEAFLAWIRDEGDGQVPEDIPLETRAKRGG